jgi:hypothetical protein
MDNNQQDMRVAPAFHPKTKTGYRRRAPRPVRV